MKYNLDLSPEERENAKAVLRPTGYRILVAVAKVQDKIGSIIIPDARKSDEEVASILGTVIDMGPDCYRDAVKFPTENYCSIGDVIMMASYSGRRLKIGDREFRLINDDTVMAVVSEPDQIERAN